MLFLVFFFKQKAAYEMRISDWSSDVCSSDLLDAVDIQQLEVVGVIVRTEETVDVDADVRAAAGGRDRRADAADARLHGGPGRIYAQTLRQLLGIGKLVEFGGGQLLRLQRVDRAWYVALFFLATLCESRPFGAVAVGP